MTSSCITRLALPLVAKALLKLSITLLIASHLTVPCGWALRLFADLTIQFLRHLPALVSPANAWASSYEWSWHILAVAVNFFAN
jgi:hypothetical protein